MKTTKGGKVMNPTDAYRKELRKKELKRNKKERKKVREVGILKKDPEIIREQIVKLEMQKGDGAQDKARKHKKRQLQDTLDLVLKKRKEHQDKMREKGEAPVMFSHLGPPRRRTTAEEDPKPEDSVYYHPTMNPTGAPPPGKPPMYKSSIGPRIPLPSSSSAGASSSISEQEEGISAIPPPPLPPPLPDSDLANNDVTGTSSSQQLTLPSALPNLPVALSMSLPPPPPPPGRPPRELLLGHASRPPPPPPPPIHQQYQNLLASGVREADDCIKDTPESSDVQDSDQKITGCPPPPPPSAFPLKPLIGQAEAASDCGPIGTRMVVPPPPPPPPAHPHPGQLPAILGNRLPMMPPPHDMMPPGVSRFPPPPPDMRPPLLQGFLSHPPPPPPPPGIVAPPISRPLFPPPPPPPTAAAFFMPPVPSALTHEDDLASYRPSVPLKPSYVKSAASTVVKRPLAQHTPELTAMVPASVRVRREIAAPKSKPKAQASATTGSLAPSITTTAVAGKISAAAAASSTAPKMQSMDDSYMAFLEDMKQLGALDG